MTTSSNFVEVLRRQVAGLFTLQDAVDVIGNAGSDPPGRYHRKPIRHPARSNGTDRPRADDIGQLIDLDVAAFDPAELL